MKFRSRRLRAVANPFIDHPDCAPEPTWPDKEYRLTELSAEASASASVERPGLSLVNSPDDVSESPGQPTSTPELIERIDILKEDFEYLRRENLRLHSELNQAIAQRDIARRQRDEARARNAGDGAMTGLRARLEHALLRHAWTCSTCNYERFRNDNHHLADVLLSLPGIAIVELPKQPSVAAIQAVVNKYDPEWAARFAADLLAAANAAEQSS